MAKGMARCNVCGSIFDVTDEDANIGLHKIIEYGNWSKYEVNCSQVSGHDY